MAQLVKRTRKGDGIITAQVKWREDGAWVTERFAKGNSKQNVARATSFMEDVNANGDRTPEGWIKGVGWAEAVVDERPTVGQVADLFFADQKRRVKLGKLTQHYVTRSRRTYEIHLQTQFDHMALADVTRADVEDWVDVQLDEVPARDGSMGAAPKSIANRHSVLYQIMQHGQIKKNLRADNPCLRTELPEQDARLARQIRFFQKSEWALFRGCLAEDVHLMMDLALATGVRWGELSAMRVGDMDFSLDGDRVVIHITRAWSQRVSDDTSIIKATEGENKSWKLGPPKNRSARFVVVNDDVATRLRAEVVGKAPNDYVFTTRFGNPWRYPDFYTDRWEPAREEAVRRGLTKHATPHMLRHSCVVWSLEKGVEIHKISVMLGHASIQITFDIYGGLINLQDPAMAQAMAAALLSVDQIVVSAPTREELAVRPVRTRRRKIDA